MTLISFAPQEKKAQQPCRPHGSILPCPASVGSSALQVRRFVPFGKLGTGQCNEPQWSSTNSNQVGGFLFSNATASGKKCMPYCVDASLKYSARRCLPLLVQQTGGDISLDGSIQLEGSRMRENTQVTRRLA